MHKFIELLESQLGYSEKSGGYTKFGDWYGKNVEFDADYTAAPWCDMYLSWAAEKLGYQEWVGQFAYTVHHAQWFRQQDAWGTVPVPGAIVFFDWSGSDRIDHIDHVGIVTGVEGGRIHTIEGNIDGGVAKRKERDTGKVVGYGYPEKIKARLDREATEKQTVVTPSGAAGDNAVAIGPGPDLLAMLPAPLTARETRTSTAPGEGPVKAPGTTGPAPRHAAGTTTGKTGTAGTAGKSGKTGSAWRTGESGGDAEAAPGSGDRTASGGDHATSAAHGDRATAGAPAGARATASGGRTSPGKHAKASTADTSALAVAPAATARDLAAPTPGFDTPAILAPVLLAAVAILAHGKARQSRTRTLAPAAVLSPPLSPSSRRTSSRRTSSRRTPGRRRAPGRRRMSGDAPARTLPYAPPPARGLPEAPAAPETGDLFTPAVPTPANTPFTRDLPAASAPANTPFTRDVPDAPLLHDPLETPALPEPGDLFTPAASAPRQAPALPGPRNLFTPALRPASRASALSEVPAPETVALRRRPVPGGVPAVGTGFPSVTTPVARVEESRVPDRRDDRPGVPYRGRRRLHEHPVVESSTLVQDAPPRGRRHRRTDSVATTAVPVVPARPGRPARPARPARVAASARPVTEPGAVAPHPAARPHQSTQGTPVTQGTPAVPAVPARSTEPGDVLVHSGYRGRRRAETLV
ncbi:CHAP domain-containing protein [Streptosporangium sp. NPDC048865]|uniref:CHAP domain-containing protein n=1 Tax=Streptosporangium sp. NPDC048865 TaxID=3155766 RepID=UPI0034354DF7